VMGYLEHRYPEWFGIRVEKKTVGESK